MWGRGSFCPWWLLHHWTRPHGQTSWRTVQDGWRQWGWYSELSGIPGPHGDSKTQVSPSAGATYLCGEWLQEVLRDSKCCVKIIPLCTLPYRQEVPYCLTSVKGRAHTYFVDASDIHTSVRICELRSSVLWQCIQNMQRNNWFLHGIVICHGLDVLMMLLNPES